MDDPGLGWHLRTADLILGEPRVRVPRAVLLPDGRPALHRASVVGRHAVAVGLRLGAQWVAVSTPLRGPHDPPPLYACMTAEGINWLLANCGHSWLPWEPPRPGWRRMFSRCRPWSWWRESVNGSTPVRFPPENALVAAPLPSLAEYPRGFSGRHPRAGDHLPGRDRSGGRGAQSRRPHAARKRLRWWTVLGDGLFAVTLVNPYGLGLYLWNLRMIADPFIQTNSPHAEVCRPVTDSGWFRIELLVLLFPHWR